MIFTKEEKDILQHALILRESAMLRDVEAYKKQGNKEAIADCMKEWRKTHELAEKIYNDK